MLIIYNGLSGFGSLNFLLHVTMGLNYPLDLAGGG
jgi:hypothetical protein